VTALADDLLPAAILGSLFLAVLAAAELWIRRGGVQPEHTRKLVHAAGGVLCLALPFAIESAWTVAVLTGTLSLLFVAAKRHGRLRSLHAVDRPSRGAELFPVAVFLVYLLAHDQAWLYVSALLVLAVGDASAALVGRRYGAHGYAVEESRKSLEGSLVFLVVAFLAILLPTLLLAEFPRDSTVLAALQAALLVTLFEAISLGGLDNLFVPLGVVVVLSRMVTKQPVELAFQSLSLLVIFAMISWIGWRRRSFDAGGAIGFALFAYGIWALGNWQWALPLLVGLLLFVSVWYVGHRHGAPRPIGLRLVLRTVAAPLLVAALANGTREFRAGFGPYLAACGAVLCFALWDGDLGPSRARMSRAFGAALIDALGVVLLSVAVTALVPWLVQRQPVRALAAVGAAVGVVALAFVVLQRLRPPPPPAPPPGTNAERRRLAWSAELFLLSLVAAGLVLALQLYGVAPAWNPTWTLRPW
jgi:phytol kinase